MKFNDIVGLAKVARVASLALLLAVTSLNAVRAQEESEKANDADPAVEVEKALKQLNGHMNKGDWKEVQKLMTEEAWDSYCSRLVQQCISLTKIQIEIDIPGLDDARDAIEDALEKHDLDELEVDGTFELRIGGKDEEEDEDETDDRSEMEKSENPILIALDQKGKRVEIIQALFDAHRQSPFNMSLFNSDVKNVEAKEDDEKSFFVTVEPQPQERDSDDGIQIKMMSPPMVILMKKSKGGWMFGGLDMKRTAQEMKNYSPMGDGPRTDF